MIPTLFGRGSGLRRVIARLKRPVFGGWHMLRVWRHKGAEGVAHWRRWRDEWGQIADPYQNWILWMEPRRTPPARQRRQVESFSYRPRISIVTPVYNPPPDVLEATLRSVLAQTYENWELCLADGNSQTPGVKETLARFAQADPRIRVTYLEQNEGISGNSNRALQMGRGDFVLLLDHDDILAPDALFEVVKLLKTHPDTNIVYFDEDKLSADGSTRLEPWFKPHAWSPEMLLSVNYLMHSVLHRRLIKEVGGFDPATDGAQDWDLLLRCTEKTRKIRHIPRILYHWRKIPGSAAAEFTAKPWVFEAQARSVTAHLRRQGVPDPRLTFVDTVYPRPVWPTRGAMISLILPLGDRPAASMERLNALFAQTAYPHWEALLLGPRRPGVREEARLRWLADADLANRAGALNQAGRQAVGEMLLFLDPDLVPLAPDWLEEMARWAERPEIGAVGAKLLGPDRRVRHAGLIAGLNGPAAPLFRGAQPNECGMFGCVDWYRNYGAVSGDCLLVRRDLFEAVGGFSASVPLREADADLCRRLIAQGYRIVYTPFAELIYSEAAAGSGVPIRIDTADPYFNPNLSAERAIPTFPTRGERRREAI
ncbi:MAG TPA: glycosyltransferase [Chthonomonadaceae bacterium]|nr:glycosyltransferase [Chthonomonadaceae bacterium]